MTSLQDFISFLCIKNRTPSYSERAAAFKPDNEDLTLATFRPYYGVCNPYDCSIDKDIISITYRELKTLCTPFSREDILKVIAYITDLTPILQMVVNLLQLILKNEEPDISSSEATTKIFPRRISGEKRTLAGFWPASYCPTPLWLAITTALFPFSLASQKEKVFCMKNWWCSVSSRSALVGTRFENLEGCDCPKCIEQKKAVAVALPASEFDALSREELIEMLIALRKAGSSGKI